MPIYEYRCTKCEDLIEVLQKINDRPLRKCKKCSGRLEKQVSRTAFQLKGGGWFSSGYTKSSGKSGPDTGTAKSDKKKTKAKKKDSGSETKGQLSAASA